jgi:hypothetical protein
LVSTPGKGCYWTPSEFFLPAGVDVQHRLATIQVMRKCTEEIIVSLYEPVLLFFLLKRVGYRRS